MGRISYLFDPLCGWCYGAMPALERLKAHEDFSIDLVPCGLFSGEGAFTMHASFAAHVWEADQRISRLSGQRFSDEYRANILKRYGVMIDSGASTLALTAVRLSTPDREFETLKAIQHTRYIEGRNNSDAAVINDVLSGLGLMDVAARFVAPDEELLVANRARIAAGRTEMRRHGVNGVPALIINTGQREKLVSSSVLYGAPDDLLEVLTTA